MAASGEKRVGVSKDDENYRRNLQHDGQRCFFATTRSPRKEYFTIHPEWASEVMTASQRCATFPPRRCRSAPPAFKSRNPITWENPDVPDKR